MFCPKCGKGEQTPNAYCRSCGEWLPDVSNLHRRGGAKLPPEKRLQMTLVFNLLSAIFALTSAIALMISIAGKDAVNPGAVIAISFCFAITAWQVISFIFTFQLRQELIRRRQGFQTSKNQLETVPIGSNALPAADASQFFRPMTSVTENTTSLLEPAPIQNTQKFD